MEKMFKEKGFTNFFSFYNILGSGIYLPLIIY